jgi:hypothetical protein
VFLFADIVSRAFLRPRKGSVLFALTTPSVRGRGCSKFESEHSFQSYLRSRMSGALSSFPLYTVTRFKRVLDGF